MILTLLVLSIALFCWSLWKSASLPEYKKPEYLPQKVATRVIVEEYQNDFDEDPPTIVMPRK